MHRQIDAPLYSPVMALFLATLTLCALSPRVMASPNNVPLAACLSNVELLKVVRSLSDAEFEEFCALTAEDRADFIQEHGFDFPTETEPPIDIDSQPRVGSQVAPSQKVQQRKNGLTEWLEPTHILLSYVDSLPAVRSNLLAEREENSETELAARSANSKYIQSIKHILVTLTSFYRENPFRNRSPEAYFTEVISSKFEWYESIAWLDAGVKGFPGTMYILINSDNVADDLDTMVEQMVGALVNLAGAFDYRNWRRRWRDAGH